MTTYQQSIEFLKKYLSDKVMYDFEIYEYSYKTVFYNDYLEFTICEKYCSGFIELESIELGNEIVFSFYVPDKYEDFEYVLDLFLNKTPLKLC